MLFFTSDFSFRLIFFTGRLCLLNPLNSSGSGQRRLNNILPESADTKQFWVGRFSVCLFHLLPEERRRFEKSWIEPVPAYSKITCSNHLTMAPQVRFWDRGIVSCLFRIRRTRQKNIGGGILIFSLQPGKTGLEGEAGQARG